MNFFRFTTVIGSLLSFALIFSGPAEGAVPLGAGNASLLGGDLTDPTDSVEDTVEYAVAKPEDQMRPPKATWVKMRSAPNSPPGAAPHQTHAYQSWQGSPACAIFLNKPESRKWYVSFIDGGNGGPTEDDPYFCAVELKHAHVLTHFTITSAPEMPDRDPRQWAIQGSNTGDDDDWVDLYRCDAKSRNDSPFQTNARTQTTLYTSFTTDQMASAVAPDDLKKLAPRLKDHKIEKADFANTGKAYTWFRIVIDSCFNPNSTTFRDFNRPPGCSLGQLELFGVPGTAAPVVAKSRAPRIKLTPAQLIQPEAYDPAFIIMPWVGPPKEETTLDRFKELKECGFNVAFPPNLWEVTDAAEVEKFNRKYLDICQQVGLKALVWDGTIPKGETNPPPAAEIPRIEKSLDAIIARYASHPALLGYMLTDEPGDAAFPRLGLMNQHLLKKDPTHLPYINLLPAYAFNPRSTYEEHVAKYLETVKPALVSWDHYRQMFERGDESTYWYNLELMRSRCAKARIPFNQIIVSFKHMGYRECSEADLRWQVFTSLAYGSRGIQYFTYWYVKDLAWAEAPALIDKNGKKDVKWEYVRKINQRIGKLGPTLARLTSTGAYCTAPVPPGARKLPSTAPIKKIEGGSFAIGCFQNPEGKQFVMLVNRSLSGRSSASVTVNERITSAAEVSQETGKLLPPLPTKQPLAVELEPGEGRLFLLNESGLFFRPPEEIFGGRECELAGIEFESQKPEAKATGKLHWRPKGSETFATIPLAPVDATHFRVTLPADATKAPLEYYLELQEPGEKPVLEPDAGPAAPLAAVPDLSPPTGVLELTPALVKSYRVLLGWKAASDDRGVASYRVYRGDRDQFAPDEKSLRATLPGGELKFSDNTPPSKQTAWYAVQAVDLVGRVGELKYLSVPVPDHQPPDNSLTPKATPGSKSVIVSWSGELEPVVDRLEIHRGEGADGPLAKVAEVTDATATRYIDKDTKAGVQYRYAVRPRSKFGLLGASGTIVNATPLRYLKRINCGGPEAAADDGVAWEADRGKGNPALKSSGTSTWTLKEALPAPEPFKAVYQTERWANRQIQYGFDVEPGRYEIVLHFAETNPTFAEKGKRIFHILVNGQTIAENVDVANEAGGGMKPWQFRKVVDVAESQLLLELAGVKTGPAIKALEIRGLAPQP